MTEMMMKVNGEWMEEMAMMMQLSHCNVVKLYGVCVEEQPPWLVLELMEGGTLADQLFDPLGVKSGLDQFDDSFQQAYIQGLRGCSDSLGITLEGTMADLLGENVMKKMKKLEEKTQMHCVELREGMKEVMRKYDDHWRLRSRESNNLCQESRRKVCNATFCQ